MKLMKLGMFLWGHLCGVFHWFDMISHCGISNLEYDFPRCDFLAATLQALLPYMQCIYKVHDRYFNIQTYRTMLLLAVLLCLEHFLNGSEMDP